MKCTMLPIYQQQSARTDMLGNTLQWQQSLLTITRQSSDFMIILVTLCIMLVSDFSFAASDKQADRAREQIRRMQQAQSKLEKEKTQLTQEKTVLETQNKDIQDKLDQVLKELTQVKKRVAALAGESAALKKDKETLTSRLSDTEKNLSGRTEALRISEEKRGGVESTLAERNKYLENCEQKNQKLSEYSTELLEKYKGKNCFDSALQREPFSQIEQIRMENTVEEYQEKLGEQRIIRKAVRP